MANPFVQKVQMFMKMGYDQNQATSMAMGGGPNTGVSQATQQTYEKKYAPKGKNKKQFDKIKKQGGGLAEIQAAKKGGNIKKAVKQQAKRKAAVKTAIAGGVDPAVATSLGLVKKPKNFNKKAIGGIKVAQAGGGPQDQIAIMNSKNPIAKAKASTPGIAAAVDYNNKAKAILDANANNKPATEVVGGGQAFDDYNVKEKGKNFRRRRRGRRSANPQSAGVGSALKVQLNTGQGGINP